MGGVSDYPESANMVELAAASTPTMSRDISADFHSANRPPVWSVVLVAEGAAAPPGDGDGLGEGGLAQDR